MSVWGMPCILVLSYSSLSSFIPSLGSMSLLMSSQRRSFTYPLSAFRQLPRESSSLQYR